ncbi:MAG TPA: glycosyltransferase family 39 protein [Candidatus Limnocylindria bacterium]
MDRPTLLVVAVATVVGLVLRLVNLTGTSLTYDEAYSIWAVRDLQRYLGILAIDGHPPLWYAWLALWTAIFGQSDLAARLSAVVAVIPLVVLTALAAARLFDSATARWAAVFTAIWPMLVFEQRDARMYAWMPVLVVVAILLLARAVELGRRAAWAGYGVPLAALAATHHVGAVVASGLFTGSLADGRSRRGVLLSAIVAAALYAPFAILVGVLLRNYPAGQSRGIGPGSVMQALTGLTVGDSKTAEPALLLGGAAMVMAAAVIGLARSGPWRPALVVTLLVGAVVPLALSAFVFGIPPAPKYFIGVVPVLVLGTSRFAATARSMTGKSHAILTTVLLVSGTVWGLIVEPSGLMDWRGLAALVERERGDATDVYVAPWYVMITFDRYTHGVMTVHPVPDVPLVPPDIPLPTTATMRDVVERPGGPRLVLVPDWLLADQPETAAFLKAAGGSELQTGSLMRAYRFPAR